MQIRHAFCWPQNSTYVCISNAHQVLQMMDNATDAGWHNACSTHDQHQHPCAARQTHQCAKVACLLVCRQSVVQSSVCLHGNVDRISNQLLIVLYHIARAILLTLEYHRIVRSTSALEVIAHTSLYSRCAFPSPCCSAASRTVDVSTSLSLAQWM